MEIFKTYILKKEFERFQKENLLEILKCGYCQKTACESWQKIFFSQLQIKEFDFHLTVCSISCEGLPYLIIIS